MRAVALPLLMTVAVLLSLAGWLTGCGRVCARQETLSGLDGGVVPCVLPTDCPRPANVLVCGSLEDHLLDCVDCASTQCVRYLPEACK